MTEPKSLHSAPILAIETGPRYWEDATVNGVVDEDGSRLPHRTGDDWNIFIDLEQKKILDWPEGTTVSTYFKVCDNGAYWLCDAKRNRLAKWKRSYVPAEFLNQDDGKVSDYIVLEIQAGGTLADWKRPAIDLDDWIATPP